MTWGIIGGAAIGAVGSAISSSKSAKASKEAAATQAGAMDRSADLIYKQFQETKATLQPYINLGTPAFGEQSALMGLQGDEAQQAAQAKFDAMESPGLAFALKRGQGAVDQSYASRGALVSGARDKALGEHLMGIQSQDTERRFANYFNRLGAIGNVGLTASQAAGGIGGNAAAGQAQMIANAGTSLAGGQLAAAQAQQTGINNIAQGLGGIYQAWRG